MVTIWHCGKYDPYDMTVYDEKWRRKKFIEILQKFEKDIEEAHNKRAEEFIKKHGIVKLA